MSLRGYSVAFDPNANTSHHDEISQCVYFSRLSGPLVPSLCDSI